MSTDLDDTAVALLLRHHGVLGDLFASHQQALVDRRWAQAARLLEEYEQGLLSQIHFEERHLLPRCEAIGGAQRPRAIYKAEHRRIEQLLREAADRLACTLGSEITPAILASLLDEERTLKRLMEHHREREERVLTQELSAATASRSSRKRSMSRAS